jgi:hypothetical protein
MSELKRREKQTQNKKKYTMLAYGHIHANMDNISVVN